MNILSWLFGKRNNKDVLGYYPDAVIVVSMSGEILYANERLLNLFRLSDEELFGMELLDIFDGGFNLVNNLAKSNDSAVVRSKLKLDEDLFFEIRASEYEDGETKIIVTIRDVSNSQKMLNKLLFEHEYLNKLTKNKNTFLSKISGELTSPIHSINGFSQAILEGLGGDVNEKQEKYLKIINKNSTTLLELVNSLVEYSKLESGLYDYEFKNFDFVNLMTSLFNEYKPKCDEKKLILNFDLNSLAKRTMYSDENIIKQVMETLLQNALETTETGSIQVVVSHPDNEFLEISGFNIPQNLPEKSYLMVKVIDTGSGLPVKDISSIFDPYMDIDRVGIFGCSAGGQESTGAVLFHPEFYKAAYSACGCHDNRMDKIWWNELWMGYPVDESYSACSNVDNAHLLSRPLMLVVGELDDNVDPASTMQVANALIKANKDFELVVIPGAHHTMGEDFGEHKRYDFFVRHLMGVTPPSWDKVKTGK